MVIRQSVDAEEVEPEDQAPTVDDAATYSDEPGFDGRQSLERAQEELRSISQVVEERVREKQASGSNMNPLVNKCFAWVATFWMGFPFRVVGTFTRNDIWRLQKDEIQMSVSLAILCVDDWFGKQLERLPNWLLLLLIWSRIVGARIEGTLLTGGKLPEPEARDSADRAEPQRKDDVSP